MRLFSNSIAAIFASIIISIWVGAATAQGVSYQDPKGRFSVGLGGDWTVAEKENGVVWYDYDDLPISMTFMAVENPGLAAAFAIALKGAGINPGMLTETRRSNWNKWSVSSNSLGKGQGLVLLGQVRDQTSYVILATGAEDLTNNPPEDVIASIQSFSFSGDDALPDTVAAFEAYASDAVGIQPPGLSIVIASPQDVIYQRGFGFADGPRGVAAAPQTVFHWGSVTKTVTATAIMQLQEQGVLDLDTPISTYLDYVPKDYPITTRHLLTHSSGLPEAADFVLLNLRLKGEPLPDFDPVAREVFTGLDELMFAPGTKSVYANPNYIILGQIVAALSGQEYVDYVRDNIFKPLGLVNTDFVYATESMRNNAAHGAIPAEQMATIASLVDQAKGPGVGETYFREVKDDMAWFQHFIVGESAGGGLMGPATELIRFGQMMLNNGELDGARVLTPESVALLQEVQTLESGEPLGIGLSWFIFGDEAHPFIEHDGGGPGLQAKLRLYMKDGLAIAIMANGAGVDRDFMTDAAANVVFNMSAQ